MYISKVVWSADQFKYFFDCILSTARLRTKSLNFVSTFAPMLSLAAHPGKASPALQADAFCDCTSKQKASRLGQYQVKLQPSFHFLYKHTYGINMSNSAIIVLTVGEAMYTSIDTTFTESEKALKSALIQHAAGLILSALLLPAHLIRWMAANAVFVRAKSPAEGVSARAANITFVCWIPLSCSTEDTHTTFPLKPSPVILHRTHHLGFVTLRVGERRTHLPLDSWFGKNWKVQRFWQTQTWKRL